MCVLWFRFFLITERRSLRLRGGADPQHFGEVRVPLRQCGDPGLPLSLAEGHGGVRPGSLGRARRR